MSRAPAPDSLIISAASLAYWASVPADENGMLGGFALISRVDLQGSRCFLAKLGLGVGAPRGGWRAARAGAGATSGGSGGGGGSVEVERGKDGRGRMVA